MKRDGGPVCVRCCTNTGMCSDKIPRTIHKVNGTRVGTFSQGPLPTSRLIEYRGSKRCGPACRQTAPPNSGFSLRAPVWTGYRGAKSTRNLFVQTHAVNTLVLKVETERAWVAWDFFEKDKIFSCSGAQTFLFL